MFVNNKPKAVSTLMKFQHCNTFDLFAELTHVQHSDGAVPGSALGPDWASQRCMKGATKVGIGLIACRHLSEEPQCYAMYWQC